MMNPFKKETINRIETKMPNPDEIKYEEVNGKEEIKEEVVEEEVVEEEVEKPRLIQPVFPTQQDINAMIFETHTMVKELLKFKN